MRSQILVHISRRLAPIKPLSIRVFIVPFLLVLGTVVPNTVKAQDGPPPEMRLLIDALMDMLQGTGDTSLEGFSTAYLTPDYRSSFDSGALIPHLRDLREASVGTHGNIGVDLDDIGLLITLSGERSATLRAIVEEDVWQFSQLTVHDSGAGSGSDTDSDGARSRQEIVEGHMRAIEGLGSSSAGPEGFTSRHLSPDFVASLPANRLAELLATIKRAAATAGGITYDRTSDGYRVGLRGGTNANVDFQVEDGPPFRISSLSVDTEISGEGSERPTVPPISWSALDDRLEAAEEDGFSGSILAIRDGNVVLERSYGLADSETGRRNNTQTIFGIGSMPIDFTRAAILLLAQRGELKLSDPVGNHIPNVPADKETVTLEHLMSGQSGLPNFHHNPETDDDYDLTWIDRGTAERRILSRELLFAPGEETAHSHSAFVLLASVIERVSGEAYGAFLRSNFFEPAGMTSTGLYGESLGYPDTRFAVGRGGDVVGNPNIPPNWGATSWLVMGSGGMMSNPADMYHWFRTLKSGAIIKGEHLERYLRRRSGMGGSDRGFFFVHAYDGGDSTIFLASNEESRGVEGLARALIELVTEDGRD